MSYELVKKINLKKHTIVSASNNIHPYDYQEWTFKADSDKDFIKEVLFNIVEGNFDLNSKSLWQWDYAANNGKKLLYGDYMTNFRERVFNDTDWSTGKPLHPMEEIKEAQTAFKDILYDNYEEVLKSTEVTKGKYVISYPDYGRRVYVNSISKKNLNGVCTIEDAKVFSSLTEADYTQKCLMSRYAIHQSNIYISTIEPSK